MCNAGHLTSDVVSNTLGIEQVPKYMLTTHVSVKFRFFESGVYETYCKSVAALIYLARERSPYMIEVEAIEGCLYSARAKSRSVATL